MIIRGGENIYPAELEQFLHTHPKVDEAQVSGREMVPVVGNLYTKLLGLLLGIVFPCFQHQFVCNVGWQAGGRGSWHGRVLWFSPRRQRLLTAPPPLKGWEENQKKVKPIS